jgi:predicted peptidase
MLCIHIQLVGRDRKKRFKGKIRVSGGTAKSRKQYAQSEGNTEIIVLRPRASWATKSRARTAVKVNKTKKGQGQVMAAVRGDGD